MSISIALRTLFRAQISNEELMQNYAVSGDKQVLSQLYNNCADDLYHFILTQTDCTLAKDICQKAWIRVIEKRQLYQRSGKFKAWLFTLARNQLFDELRRQHRLTDLEQVEEPTQLMEQASDIESAFSAALTSLPFEQREAFCLQQEGFSLNEIAGISHAPIETVKSRLRYAKKSLRNKLENHHDQ